MVAMKDNFWNSRANDGQERSHVPPTPIWIAIIRVAQIFLALLVLILTAVGASYFGSAWSSLGVTWFTFALTLIHIGWLTISLLVVPIAYNYWAQLGMEIACVIFWLASWASLAADASALGTAQRGAFGRLDSRYNTASDCIKASAGIGALLWLLFIATLVFFVISMLQHRKAQAPAAGTTGAEAGVAFEQKPGHELSPVGQQQQTPYAQPAQYAQQAPPQQYQQPQDFQQQPYQGGQPAAHVQ